MGHRHARHGAHGVAPRLQGMRDRLDLPPIGVDVDRSVVGLAASAERGGRGSRVGHGMRAVSVLPHQIESTGPRLPGGFAAAGRIVPPWRVSARVFHRLGIDIEGCAVVGWARHAEAKRRRTATVVLKCEACASTRGILHASPGGDRRRSRRRPVEAIKDHEHDVFLARIGCCHLQPIDVGLIEVGGLRVERLIRKPPVERPQPLRIPVDTVLATDRRSGHTKGIDRNQTIGMIRPAHVAARLVAPVAPGGHPNLLSTGLELPDGIGNRRRGERLGDRRHKRAKRSCDQKSPQQRHRRSGVVLHVLEHSKRRVVVPIC